MLLFWQLESATVRESAEVQDSLQSRWRLSSKQASKQEQVETLKVLYLLFVRRGISGAERRGTTYTSTGTMYAFARAPAEVDARMDSQTRNCHAPWPCRPSKPPLYVRKPQCVIV